METLCAPPQTLRRRQACYALQGPDAATELQMLAALKGLSPESLPLLPALLGTPLRRARADPAAPCYSQQQLSAYGSQQRQPVDEIDVIEDVEGSQQQQSQASGQLGSGDKAGAELSAGGQKLGGHSSQGSFGCGTLSLLGASQAQQALAAAQPLHTPSPGTQGVSGAAASSREDRVRLEETKASDDSSSQKGVAPQAEDAASIIQRFSLNEEQADALLAMERWSTPGTSQVDHAAPSGVHCQIVTHTCRHSSSWNATTCLHRFS